MDASRFLAGLRQNQPRAAALPSHGNTFGNAETSPTPSFPTIALFSRNSLTGREQHYETFLRSASLWFLHALVQVKAQIHSTATNTHHIVFDDVESESPIFPIGIVSMTTAAAQENSEPIT